MVQAWATGMDLCLGGDLVGGCCQCQRVARLSAVALAGCAEDRLARAEREPHRRGDVVGARRLGVLRFLSGFVLALVVGVPLGLLMGRSRVVGDLVDPVFNTLRNVPPIAWAPFGLLWFGASFGSQMFVIFTAAFPPILMNSHRGIRLVDEGLIKAARMLGAKPAAVLFQVALPAALPMVVAGARIGVANGWLALVGAEIIAGPGALTGLGFLVLVGQQNLQADFSISAMVVIGLLGAAFDYAVVRLERALSKH